MAYTSYRNGLDVQTASAIDKRLLLSKAEMLKADDDFMLPNQYFCICKDDGKVYLYNATNEVDQVTGRYRLLDDVLDIKFVSEEQKENLDSAVAEGIKESPVIKEALEEAVEDILVINGGLIVDDSADDDTNADGGLITD